jgi:hypothetical protein
MATTAGLCLLGLLGGCSGEDLEQSASCAQYVACIAAMDATRGTETDLLRFAPEGSCWGFSEAGFDLCDRACTDGLAFVQERYTAPPEECLP